LRQPRLLDQKTHREVQLALVLDDHQVSRGLIAAWDSGDGVTRRGLLATLFSDIHVSQGRVVSYTPRHDRQAQVTRLMDNISWKLSVKVGGDGSPTPLTDSLRLIV
jgi:hypothetical protein